MDMPMPPMAPPMGGAGAPPMGGAPGGPDLHTALVQMLGEARKLAANEGLDFDALLEESAQAAPAGGPTPPPPPPMDHMGPPSGGPMGSVPPM